MTQPNIAYLALGVVILLITAAALLLLPSQTNARLLERARGATRLADRAVDGPRQTIRIDAPGQRGTWQRIATAFGYNPNLPKAYAASVLMVALISGLMGLLVFWGLSAVFGATIAAPVAILLGLALVRFQFRRKTKAYAKLLFNQIPDALSLVVRSVRAGLPVGDALRSVSTEMPSPTSDEFGRMMGEVSLGVPLETALWSMYGRTQVREFSFLAVTLGLQAQTGGNLAETLDNLVDMVRRRVALVGKARALSGEARMSCAILGGLPFATAALLTLVRPSYVGVLFTDPRGANFLFTFVVLLSLGVLSLRWLLQRATED